MCNFLSVFMQNNIQKINNKGCHVQYDCFSSNKKKHNIKWMMQWNKYAVVMFFSHSWFYSKFPWTFYILFSFLLPRIGGKAAAESRLALILSCRFRFRALLSSYSAPFPSVGSSFGFLHFDKIRQNSTKWHTLRGMQRHFTAGHSIFSEGLDEQSHEDSKGANESSRKRRRRKSKKRKKRKLKVLCKEEGEW